MELKQRAVGRREADSMLMTRLELVAHWLLVKEQVVADSSVVLDPS